MSLEIVAGEFISPDEIRAMARQRQQKHREKLKAGMEEKVRQFKLSAQVRKAARERQQKRREILQKETLVKILQPPMTIAQGAAIMNSRRRGRKQEEPAESGGVNLLPLLLLFACQCAAPDP